MIAFVTFVKLVFAACCYSCSTAGASTSANSPTILLSSARFSTTENVELALTGIVPRASSVKSDAVLLIELNASATHGSLSVPTLDGMFVHGMDALTRAKATLVSGSAISFSASESISQQALAALTYLPSVDWNGNDTLFLSIGTKLRHSGNFIATANASVVVQVSSANSKPSLLAPKGENLVLNAVEDT